MDSFFNALKPIHTVTFSSPRHFGPEGEDIGFIFRIGLEYRNRFDC